MLSTEQVVPNFSLLDQDGVMHNLEDYKGKTILLYFYPKDDTPGCTKEACAIADVYNEFEKMNVKVFGVSADSPESHKAFAEKYNLPFTLLSDSNHETIKAYGAYYEEDATGLGIHSKRISYLISPEGKVIKAYPEVDPASHALEILQDLGASRDRQT